MSDLVNINFIFLNLIEIKYVSMAITLPLQCPLTICKYNSNVAGLVF